LAELQTKIQAKAFGEKYHQWEKKKKTKLSITLERQVSKSKLHMKKNQISK
jgi:hypothetical protein